MLTPAKQVEIAKRGMDAAFGYTHAAINAAYETNARTLSVWTHVAETVLPKAPIKEEVWEWSGAPKRPHSTLLAADQPSRTKSPANSFAGWSDLMQASHKTWFKCPPSPFAWWAWMPQTAVPATWPWAYGMISSGVPGSVAWPMAEANVALLDAAKKTAEAAAPAAFPAYQSANGFASAQVWMGSPLTKSFVTLAPATALLWPWIERTA
jgi:hypothetical protein